MSLENVEHLPNSFWNRDNVPPIPLLQQLNDWVIKQNEKRLPKWKFRFAADLAMQIQSRLTRKHALLLEGWALQTEDVSAKLFREPKQLHGCRRRYVQVKFKLFTGEYDTWIFKPTMAGCSRGDPVSGAVNLRQRIVTALHPDHFTHLRPELMLSAHCLCCGKGLTDPASMARWVGPECWGSASTNVPRVFRAMAA